MTFPKTKRGVKFDIFISTAVLLGIILIYVVVSSINSYAFSNIIDINARSVLTQNIQSTNHEIDCFVSRVNLSLTTMKSQLSVDKTVPSNRQLLQSILFSQILAFPDANGVMFGRPDGSFLFIRREPHFLGGQPDNPKTAEEYYSVKVIQTVPQKRVDIYYYASTNLALIPESTKKDVKSDTYDPRKRPWYKSAVESGQISWSDPYVFFTSGKPGITVSVPVSINDVLVGVVGIDIELESLNIFLNNLNRQLFADLEVDGLLPEALIFFERTGGGGSTNKQVIASTQDFSAVADPKKNLPASITALDSPDVKTLTRQYIESGTERSFGVFEQSSKGSLYYMFNSNAVDGTGVRLSSGFIIPFSLISGNIVAFTDDIRWTFLITGVICVVIGIGFAYRFSKPINGLSQMADSISKLDFDSPPKIKYTFFRELNNAIYTFENMWKSLKEHKERNDELSLQLKKSYRETILRLAAAAEYKDKDTHGHLYRISEYSAMLGEELGLSEDEIERLRFAAPMHDIGKIGIPDAILMKPGRYTEDEFSVMKNHPQYGEKLLDPPESEVMRLSACIALNHHEKYNGTGYPNGKSGEDIPFEAAIVAVADVYDALRSKRCYKDAMPHDKVVEIIVSDRGKHFSPTVVDAFMKIKDKIEQVPR